MLCSEKLLNFYQTTWLRNQGDINLHSCYFFILCRHRKPQATLKLNTLPEVVPIWGCKYDIVQLERNFRILFERSSHLNFDVMSSSKETVSSTWNVIRRGGNLEVLMAKSRDDTEKCWARPNSTLDGDDSSLAWGVGHTKPSSWSDAIFSLASSIKRGEDRGIRNFLTDAQ